MTYESVESAEENLRLQTTIVRHKLILSEEGSVGL